MANESSGDVGIAVQRGRRRDVTKVEDWLTCSEMMIMDGSRKGTLFPRQARQVLLCSD